MKAKIMLKADAPAVRGKEPTERYPITLRITHGDRRAYIRLGYFCRKNQWNGRVMATYPGYKDLNDTLNTELKRANAIIQKLIQANDVNLSSFKREWANRDKVDVWTYFDRCIEMFKEQNRYNMYRDYTNCRNRLCKKGWTFRYYTYKVLKDFEHSLRKEGCKDITIRHYFITLRALFNRARKEGVTDYYPFGEYRISGLDIRTHPRALTLEELKAIVSYSPPEHSTTHHAKLLFLFSFYTMGMNLADMAYLTSENIQRDRLIYKRQKTGQMYSVLLMPPTLEILAYFERYFPDEGFLFPILKKGLKPLKIGQRINSMTKKYNKALKDLAAGAKLDVPLTFYVARHTWATLMKKQGTPIAVISEGLGHTTEKTTRIYLDRFDNATLDQANELLLNVTLN